MTEPTDTGTEAAPLPVTLTVGEHTMPAGSITFDPGADFGAQLAVFLRELADAAEAPDDDEDGD